MFQKKVKFNIIDIPEPFIRLFSKYLWTEVTNKQFIAC